MAEHGPGDDPLQWLRDSIPGEPGTDYPIFSSVQETSFSCENKVFGGKFEKIMPIYVQNWKSIKGHPALSNNETIVIICLEFT